MMTYIERHGGYLSSISSTRYPSNVNKSREPCPVLSSSIASTDSDSGSIPASIDSISSYSYRKRPIPSIGHSNDYYTNKRIDELHERMDDIQMSNFLKFINYHLSLKKEKEILHIDDLIKDLSNGHILIDLIEILSSTKLKREHGHTRFHSLTNVQYVLDYLKTRVQYINISPHDIVSGNRKQILALLWIIMKTFDFPSFRITNKNCFVEYTLLGFGQDRSIIIKWLNNILNHSLNTEKNYIKDFYLETWINGYYLSLIIKYLIPLSQKYLTIKCFDYLKELNNSSDKQKFLLCLNLSNYCFNTITIIDYKDKTDKCLFKYFTELQKNVLTILKTNQIGKLIQNNPYTKQILETVVQTTTTTEHSSHIIDNNDEYLTCIDDDHQQISSIEKHTRLSLNSLGQSTSSSDDLDECIDNEQTKFKRINRWETIESKSHVINGHHNTLNEEQIKVIAVKPQQPTVSIKNIEQFSIIDKQPLLKDEEIEPSIVSKTENDKSEQLQEDEQQLDIHQNSVSTVDKSEQIVNEDPQDKIEQNRLSLTNENVVPVQETITENQFNEENKPEQSQEDEQQLDIHQNSVSTVDKSEQIVNEDPQENIEQNRLSLTNENVVPVQETVTENQFNEENKPEQLQDDEEQPGIDQNSISTDEKIVTEDPKENIEQNQLSLINEKVVPLQEPITFNEENHESTIECEKFVQPEVISNEKLEQVIDEETVQPIVLNQETVTTSVENEKIEQEESLPSVTLHQECEQKPIKVIKNESPVLSNRQLEQSVIEHEKLDPVPVPIINKKLEQPAQTTATFVEKNSPSVTNKKSEKPVTSNSTTNKSTNSNKKPVANPKKSTSNEQVIISSPEQQKVVTTLSKSPEIPNKEPVQATASIKKQEKKKVISPIISTETLKHSLITSEDTQSISITSAITDSKQSEVLIEKEQPANTVMEESNENIKQSSTKNKKSKRSNGKKTKAKNPSNKTIQQQSTINHEEEKEDEEKGEIESSIPSINEPTIIESEVQNSSTTTTINSNNSSALRSRKTKKKKQTISTSTTIIEKSSSPIIPTSSTNRNLFVIIKQSLVTQKIIAFKCIFILACLCFSIIIIVLSHK